MTQIADFIEAPNSGGDYKKVLLVVHVTISPETDGAARAVVRNWNQSRNGSTQFVVDNREIIQAVRESAYAWSAGTTANKWGIHVEHCGMLQSVREWRDGYSTAELELSAPLFADLAKKHGIPARRIGPDQIRKAVASGDPADGGICGHIDITNAFPGETTHTDPGQNFPWDHFIELVQQHANPEDDMALDDKALEQIADAVWAKEIGGGDNRRPSALHLIWASNNARRAAASTVDVDKLAAAVVAALPAGGVTEATVVAGVKKALAELVEGN